MLHKIEIIEDIGQKQKIEAANVLYEAFEKKINAFMKPKTKAIDAHIRAMQNERAFFVTYNNSIIGIAGLHYRGKNFIEFDFSELNKTFNFLKSTLYYLAFKLMTPKIKEDTLRIEVLAVDKKYRGQGIGSMLMGKIIDFAAESGFKKIVLEVVDTNPGARTLYERLGFEKIKTVKHYFFTRRAGFSVEYIMSYNIA